MLVALLVFVVSLGASPTWAADPAGAPAPAAGLSHCAADERVVFSCATTSGGKHISVCATTDWGRVTYRFGRIGSIERTSPVSGDPQQVVSARLTWARGWEDSLRFPGDDGVTYRVVHAVGSGIDGDSNNYAGVKVEKGDKELAFVRCVGSTATGEGLEQAADHVRPATP